jgi:uncharacterized protein (TIGR03067 family)
MGCGDARDREAEAEALRADLALATAEYLPVRDGGEQAQLEGDLPGSWRAIHIVVDGQELPKHDVAHASRLLEIHAGQAWIHRGDGELVRDSYKLDESQSPHVIRIRGDLLTGDIAGHDGDVHGIVDASGDTLRICFAPLDLPVPQSFQPQPGATCVTYQRVR